MHGRVTNMEVELFDESISQEIGSEEEEGFYPNQTKG